MDGRAKETLSFPLGEDAFGPYRFHDGVPLGATAHPLTGQSPAAAQRGGASSSKAAPPPPPAAAGGANLTEPSLLSSFLTDDVLYRAYYSLLKTDPEVRSEAIAAAIAMSQKPFDGDDLEAVDLFSVPGYVQRRAPKNPLASPLLGKYRMKRGREKIKDPALERNPLRGRLIVTLTTTALLLWVFFQSLIANKSKTGHFYASKSENGMIGPASITLYELGGLSANMIRAGETYRLFWSFFMHSGWLHIVFNLLCQAQYLIMMEPDWGFWRCLLLFGVSAVTGNLISAWANPCSTTVGSSGALFGMMGAMGPYCLEYWDSIPRPCLIVIFSVIVFAISLLTGFTGNTDNWAHMGGGLGGFLFGFATITSVSAFDDHRFHRWCLSLPPLNHMFARQLRQLERDSIAASSPYGKAKDNEGRVVVDAMGNKHKTVAKKAPLVRAFQKKVQPRCRCGMKEWVVRVIALATLAIIWSLCFHRLFIGYQFQPYGHVSFSGVRSCCCCYYNFDGPVLEERRYWLCNYCTYTDPTWKGKTFENLCQAENTLRRLREDHRFDQNLLSDLKEIGLGKDPQRLLALEDDLSKVQINNNRFMGYAETLDTDGRSLAADADLQSGDTISALTDRMFKRDVVLQWHLRNFTETFNLKFD